MKEYIKNILVSLFEPIYFLLTHFMAKQGLLFAARDIDFFNVYQAQAAGNGTKTTFYKEFPLAKGWYKLGLNINIGVTIGTGSGPITEGELNYIKNIQLRSDKNEIFFNAPGRALYRWAQMKTGRVPNKTAIAASTANYPVQLPLWFIDPKFQDFRNMDTILDSGRYKAIYLDVTLGTSADLFTTTTGVVVTPTIDLELMTTPGILPAGQQPISYQTVYAPPPVDRSVQQYIDLDKVRDLAMRQLFLQCTTGGTAGVAFSGVLSDALINDLDVIDQDRYYMKQRLWTHLQQDTQEQRLFDTRGTGFTAIDFARDNSNFSSLYTGNKATLRVQWRNNGSASSGDLVSPLIEGVRALAR